MAILESFLREINLESVPDTAANREVKPVLDYPARQRGRTLRWPSDAALMGVANWVTVNP